jgi:hypothetical protein
MQRHGQELPLLQAFTSMLIQGSLDYTLNAMDSRQIGLDRFEESEEHTAWKQAFSNQKDETYSTYLQ